MPKLQPVPIRTRGVPYLTALCRWFATRRWMLLEDWRYVLPDGVEIVIPQGFEFDGASIPRIFWMVLSPIGILLIPGLVHDYAYRYDELLYWPPTKDVELLTDFYKPGAGRCYWDCLFRDVAIAVNGFRWINYVAWSALVVFGIFAWRSRRTQEERRAGE